MLRHQKQLFYTPKKEKKFNGCVLVKLLLNIYFHTKKKLQTIKAMCY